MPAVQRKYPGVLKSGFLLLSLGLLSGCAPGGAYLQRGVSTLPSTIDSSGSVVSATACNSCGAVDNCRCRIFPGWQRLLSCLTCGAGCEEVYWGEWRSDPPKPCDDCMGHPMASSRVAGLPDFPMARSGQDARGHVVVSEEAVIAASHESQTQPLWKSSGWSGRHAEHDGNH
ncbi:MAG: hypothetical protein VX644_01810 [Planctomycetota bacterium]|nr:hypothetical protein [Planctomycetota bacterium]